MSFGRLLDIASIAKSRDVRDKVYGLVGMMDPQIARRLLPDYKMNPSRIFSNVARVFIITYNYLEPLRESNPWGKTGTPSWAADWTWDGRLPYSRTESPPFWTPRNAVQNPMRSVSYHASAKTPPKLSFSTDGLLLTCQGFLIDEIAGLSARGRGIYIWLEKTVIQSDSAKSIYEDVVSTSKALYHTLVADRVWNGHTASDRHAAILSLPSTFSIAEPQFRARGWESMASRGGYYYRWEKWRIVNQDFRIGDQRLHDYFTDKIPSDASEDDYNEAYSCYDRTCKSRRLMTTVNGYLG